MGLIFFFFVTKYYGLAFTGLLYFHFSKLWKHCINKQFPKVIKKIPSYNCLKTLYHITLEGRRGLSSVFCVITLYQQQALAVKTVGGSLS